MSTRRAQTATEYLIILAVVIVIALIVIGVLGGIPSIGGGAKENTQNLYSKSGLAVGMESWAIGPSGTRIKFKNNAADSIELNSMVINGSVVNLSQVLTSGGSVVVTTSLVNYSVPTNYDFPVVLNYTEFGTGGNFIINDSQFRIVGVSSN